MHLLNEVRHMAKKFQVFDKLLVFGKIMFQDISDPRKHVFMRDEWQPRLICQ